MEEPQKPGQEMMPRIALVGGGRYDNLLKLLGGEETKASGGSMGMERVIIALKNKEIKFPKETEPSVFLAQIGNMAKRKGLKLLEEFRKANIEVAESFGKDSLKAQLKIADKIGAKYTLLLGQKEALENSILIRDMANGKQESVKLEKTVKEMKKRLKK
jgi:histidyl-tRNA synthetase